jgi:hypothetical protein
METESTETVQITDCYCRKCDALDLREQKRLNAQTRAKQLISGEPAKPGALSIVEDFQEIRQIGAGK